MRSPSTHEKTETLSQKFTRLVLNNDVSKNVGKQEHKDITEKLAVMSWDDLHEKVQQLEEEIT